MSDAIDLCDRIVPFVLSPVTSQDIDSEYRVAKNCTNTRSSSLGAHATNDTRLSTENLHSRLVHFYAEALVRHSDLCDFVFCTRLRE